VKIKSPKIALSRLQLNEVAICFLPILVKSPKVALDRPQVTLSYSDLKSQSWPAPPLIQVRFRLGFTRFGMFGMFLNIVKITSYVSE